MHPIGCCELGLSICSVIFTGMITQPYPMYCLIDLPYTINNIALLLTSYNDKTKNTNI